MAYIRRVSDDRPFEVFGTRSAAISVEGEAKMVLQFLIFTKSNEWQWVQADRFVPLEIIEAEDFDLEDEEEDEKEDML